ncbi:MAG: tryptophan-rich sensory protein [Candidatus Micrarchaeota archaeon]|nr:tryptophan-rich sensory protein [Candidatus Micrarchaeota archaeon]
MKSNKLAIAVLFVLLCLAAGAIGSFFTFPSIQGWYSSLNKPFFNPPNWVFGPVWTLLYVLMGIAAYLVYEKGIKKKNVKEALAFFGAQLFLNVLWSLLFFGLHSPLCGLLCIIALWVMIALTMKKFYMISRTAGLLFIPYILWVSFAAILNLFIWGLN